MSHSLIDAFDAAMADRESSVAKDLKLNFKRAVTDSALSAEEAALAVISFARSSGLDAILGESAHRAALDLGLAPELVREAEESAAIMGMLNVYYRFRHFVDKEPGAAEAYGAAKLRMQSLAQPAMGKERFELLAIGVSMINGCEKCVVSHEKALMQMGVTREKIHDIARLAASVQGLAVLLRR